jgi:hypothetical protein
MTRKATDVVTTIGIDIGKNSLHLIGLEGCFGSTADQQPVHPVGLLSGVKQTKSAGKRTSIVTASSLLNRRTMPA